MISERNKYLILILLALVWGTSFILIKKSVDVYSPYQVGALRVGIAGLALTFLGIPALKRLPKDKILWAGLAGFFGNFLPMFLFPIAETEVSSSLAGTLNSLVPIFTLIFGYLLFKTKSTRLQVVGAVVGFAGANVLMYFGNSNAHSENNLFYAFLIIVACACYAISGLIVKEKLNDVKSLDLGGVVFTIWMFPSLIILIFSGFFNEFHGSQEQLYGLGYVAILGLVGTAAAMLIFYRLIQQTTAVFATSVTYLMPIVAIIWGVIAGEELNVWFILGGILILIGIFLIREKKL